MPISKPMFPSGFNLLLPSPPKPQPTPFNKWPYNKEKGKGGKCLFFGNRKINLRCCHFSYIYIHMYVFVCQKWNPKAKLNHKTIELFLWDRRYKKQLHSFYPINQLVTHPQWKQFNLPPTLHTFSMSTELPNLRVNHFHNISTFWLHDKSFFLTSVASLLVQDQLLLYTGQQK